MGIGNAISNLGSDVSSGVQSFFGASPETAGTVTDALGGAAAGAGLGALTSAMPKPLLPVAGEPFLDVLLFELGRHGFTEIVLLASFHSEKIRAYAGHRAPAAG